MIVLRSAILTPPRPPCNRRCPPLSCGHERDRPSRRVRRQDRAGRLPRRRDRPGAPGDARHAGRDARRRRRAGRGRRARASSVPRAARRSARSSARSLRTAPTWAALANGTAGHAHDFDDTNFVLLGHPSVPAAGHRLGLRRGRDDRRRQHRAGLPDRLRGQRGARAWRSIRTTTSAAGTRRRPSARSGARRPRAAFSASTRARRVTRSASPRRWRPGSRKTSAR